MGELATNFKIGNQYRIYPGNKTKNKKEHTNKSHRNNDLFFV